MLGKKENTADESGKSKRQKPSLQIYRPPGLRGVAYPSCGKTLSKDSDQLSNTSSSGSTQSDKPRFEEKIEQRARNVAFSRSFRKPAKHLAESPVVNDLPQHSVKTKNILKPKATTKPKEKQFSSKDIEEIKQSLNNLEMVKGQKSIDDYLAGNMSNEVLARDVGQSLVHFAIEEKRQSGRLVARICAALLKCPTAEAFHAGFISSIHQYYESRSQLRRNRFKAWINFLNFISDLYASVGFNYEGGLVDVIFNVFEYMLKGDVLQSLKIEELESMIASFLSIGYDLERYCPDQMGSLRDLIRDAILDVHEPWARKMIFLILELSASGWNLPPDANEYYFQ